MRQNIEVTHGCGQCILSPSTKQVFSYGDSREKVHELFGGKTYYQSQSGRSRAGYVEDPKVFIVGGYRVDNGRTPIAEGNPVYDGIEVFVPLKDSYEISWEHPFVFRKGESLVLTKELESIIDFSRAPFQRIGFPNYTKEGISDCFFLEIYKEKGCHVKGCPQRFYLEMFNVFSSGLSFPDDYLYKIGLYKGEDGRYYHVNWWGYLDQVVESPKEAPGWTYSEEEKFCWRRSGYKKEYDI
jgi:hypothetical protein